MSDITKVAYNAKYGGFGVSNRGIQLGRVISGNPDWGREQRGSPIGRTDPVLIQVIEQMGEAASGPFSRLRIEEVPKGKRYLIDEHDGYETIMFEADYHWLTA